MLALAVLIFCVVALYAYVADCAQWFLALGAMASNIVGISLMLSRLGVFAYAVPARSRSPLDGNQESIRILGRIFAGPLGAVEIASVLRYSAGILVLTIAIWRLGFLPGWAGSSWQPKPADLRAVFGGGFGGGDLAAGDFPRRPTLPAKGSLPLGSDFWPMSLYRPCTNIEGSTEPGHKGE